MTEPCSHPGWQICQTAEKQAGFATAVSFDFLERHLRQNTGYSHPAEQAAVPRVVSTPPACRSGTHGSARVRIVKLLAVTALQSVLMIHEGRMGNHLWMSQ